MQVAARVGTPPASGPGFANLAMGGAAPNGASAAATAAAAGPAHSSSGSAVVRRGGGGAVRQSAVGFGALPAAAPAAVAAQQQPSSSAPPPLHKQTPGWDGAIRAMATNQAGALSEFNDEHNRQQGRAAFGRVVDPGQHRLPIVPHSKWQHYSQTAGHRQLLEMPATFDFKFSKVSTLKVGVPGGIKGALPGIVARGGAPRGSSGSGQ